MADISSKLDKIKSAERGEDVRDAIIGALRDINNDVPADEEARTVVSESGDTLSPK